MMMQTSSHAVSQQYGSSAQAHSLIAGSSQPGAPSTQQACGPAVRSIRLMSSMVARFAVLEPEEKRKRSPGWPASAARSS